MQLKETSTSFIIVAVSALFLSLYAFYNSFPLIFPDTMGYINHAYHGFPNNRPVFYSFFIRHISLNETLWLVIFVQGFILAWMLLYALRYLFNKSISKIWTIVYCIIISTCTAASLHSSMLMPDIFTPIMVLSFLLLCFGSKMGKKRTAWIVLVFLTSLSMHNTHFYIALGGILVLLCMRLIPALAQFFQLQTISIRKLFILLGVVLFSSLLFSTLRVAMGGPFKKNNGGAVFVLARLGDYQILQDYLHEHCDEVDFALCDHRNNIPVMSATFLWNFKNSPLYKIGGWTDANQKASAKLVKDILSRPKYLKRYLIRCIEDSFIQLFYFHIQVSPRSDNVGKEIRKHFPMYTTPYMISRQSQETMDTAYLKFVNILQSFVLAGSFILIFLLLFDKRYNHFTKAIVIVMLIMIYANSFISVAASGVYARYNSRILWLITLPAFAYLWQLMYQYLKKDKI